MDDERLQLALPEPEPNEDDDRRAPEQRATPPEERGLDPRFRRGSLGPMPISAPLAQNASSAALHAHLARLLDAPRAEQAADLSEPLQAHLAHPLEAPRAEQAADPSEPIGPHEDLERQPDGVPHLVIGLTALFSVAIAAVLIGMFHSNATFGSIAAVLIALVVVPLLVFRLGAKAERDRDHEHPSR